MSDRQRPRTGAIDKALAVLTELQAADGAMRLSDLSRRTGLPKSTTHRMLGALLASNVVVRVGSGYHATHRVGGDTAVRPHATLLRKLAPFVGDVLVRTGLTASLAVLNGTDILFLHRVHGHDGAWAPSDESGRGCAYATAAGRLLMAFDRGAARHIVDMWRLGPDETARLDQDLLRIRRDRFAMKQTDLGMTCIAVPLLGVHGYPRIALTVRGDSGRIDAERALYWMRNVADVASRTVLVGQLPAPRVKSA